MEIYAELGFSVSLKELTAEVNQRLGTSVSETTIRKRLEAGRNVLRARLRRVFREWFGEWFDRRFGEKFPGWLDKQFKPERSGWNWMPAMRKRPMEKRNPEWKDPWDPVFLEAVRQVRAAAERSAGDVGEAEQAIDVPRRLGVGPPDERVWGSDSLRN